MPVVGVNLFVGDYMACKSDTTAEDAGDNGLLKNLIKEFEAFKCGQPRPPVVAARYY